MAGAVRVADTVENGKTSVLVHCTDGYGQDKGSSGNTLGVKRRELRVDDTTNTVSTIEIIYTD